MDAPQNTPSPLDMIAVARDAGDDLNERRDNAKRIVAQFALKALVLGEAPVADIMLAAGFEDEDETPNEYGAAIDEAMDEMNFLIGGFGRPRRRHSNAKTSFAKLVHDELTRIMREEDES